MSDQCFQVLCFSLKRSPPIPQVLKRCSNHLRKSKINAMDKGKNIQMELTEEELQRKIERITRKIKVAKEEGLRVDITTAIYKDTTMTLDEDLSLQMKRIKDVEMETEGWREKFETLRSNVK